MKAAFCHVLGTLVLLGASVGFAHAQFEDKVKVELEHAALHPGMDPGMYVCAAGHLHMRGTVQNLSPVALGRIEVQGKAFDADGKLLGTAAASTEHPALSPGAKAPIDLEFVTVTGQLIQRVTKHEVRVVKAPASNAQR